MLCFATFRFVPTSNRQRLKENEHEAIRKYYLVDLWRAAYCHWVFHRRTSSDDNHHRHPVRFAEHEAGRTGHLAVRLEGEVEAISAKLPDHVHECAVVLRGRHLDLPHPQTIGAHHRLLRQLLCITIIGFPWGKMHFRLAKLALSPFGMEVV